MLSHLTIATQNQLDLFLDPFEQYTIPLDLWITTAVNYIVNNFRPFFQAIRIPISWTLEEIQSLFLAIPPMIFLLVIGLITWQLVGRSVAIYSTIAFVLVGSIGAWEPAMITLSLVLTAVLFCIVAGIPLGIACARSDRVEGLVKPILDAMQTIPRFVYLVPVVMLFGIGEVPGTIATIIIALPPLVRLTNLGIRQVSPEVVEASTAFGSTPWQTLWEVQIPLALPSILTGLNQTILFALAMSVLTAMIAAPGLGSIVLEGVGRLDVGQAAVGGLGIFLLALVLDRITQALGQTNLQVAWKKQGPIGLFFTWLNWRQTRL
ncbi:MAG: ABC transporter permease subunit [Cyanobacteriota bacterium]|nr:ABC transporter permease subunit [Cyanobacteriota bacterium]